MILKTHVETLVAFLAGGPAPGDSEVFNVRLGSYLFKTSYMVGWGGAKRESSFTSNIRGLCSAPALNAARCCLGGLQAL